MAKKNNDQATNSVQGANDTQENKVVPIKPLKDQALIDEACKAYGIAPEYVFSSRIDGDLVVLLTNGGTRVRYKEGDEVEPLDDIAITGINPKAAKRKVVAGKGK